MDYRLFENDDSTVRFHLYDDGSCEVMMRLTDQHSWSRPWMLSERPIAPDRLVRAVREMQELTGIPIGAQCGRHLPDGHEHRPDELGGDD